LPHPEPLQPTRVKQLVLRYVHHCISLAAALAAEAVIIETREANLVLSAETAEASVYESMSGRSTPAGIAG
jgi:hypothetical protein